jgi:glutamate synthase (NADPH) small chain
MTPQSSLAEPASIINLPRIEPSALINKPAPARRFTELEERILRRWDLETVRRTVEVLPCDFEQAPFEWNGLRYMLRCCAEFDIPPRDALWEQGCPLCDARQREGHSICTVELPSGRTWEIWLNKRSYEAYQILIVPLDPQGKPEHRSLNQEATREDLDDMLALKKRLPHFCIFFNARGAGNSQEHQHFQGYYAGEGQGLQVEWQPARGLWKRGNFWMAQVEGWPSECIRMRGRPDALAEWAACAIQLARSQGFSYNLLLTGSALYFARRKQLGSSHLNKTAAGALDVFDLKHIVSRSVFDWVKTQPGRARREWELLNADITCNQAETTAFVQALAARVSDGNVKLPMANADCDPAREATALELLAACASQDQAMREAARARLQSFVQEERLRLKTAMEEAPRADGSHQPGRKWTRFVRWAEPCLRPAEVRIRDSEEVNQGLRFTDALIESSRCLMCKEPFCTQGCPVVMDVKGFVKAFAEGDVKAAYTIITRDNTLPAITSRVCPQERQCQKTCVLSKRGDALSIGLLERAVVEVGELFCDCNILSDGAYSIHTDIVAAERDYPIAIIGAGPAGLTAAAELARWYTRVVIFEALQEPGGGVLKYGIPGFRLPKHTVQAALDAVKSRGVEVIFDVAVGRTITIADLRQMGFRAILLGTGAGLPKFMDIPGEELNGVITANEFLMRYNLMSAGQPGYDTPIKVGRKVVIVGGGNVAMDAARSALRAGAEEVIVMYRRAEEDMPVRAEEKDRAREEGIILTPLTAPLEFCGENGLLTSIRCQKMGLGKPDASGRRSPVPIEGSEYVLDGVDTAVLAIGTEPNTMLMDQEGLPKAKWNTVALANEQTGQTRQPDIFAAGDVAGGSTVIDAMGTARKAARGVHAYLQTLSEDARQIPVDRRLLQTEKYAISEKENLAPNIFLMKVHAPFVAAAAQAGQFVMVMNDEKAERIPLTLADWDAGSGEITLVIQTVGVSTRKLNARNVGERLFSVAGALGKPSLISHDPEKDVVVCVAGGVGIAPMYPIARANAQAGNTVVSIVGARSRDVLFWEERMRQVSASYALTLDSEGKLVTDGLKAFLGEQKSKGGLGRIARVVAAGSVGMMKAVSALTAEYGVHTVVSLNSIMLCGIGMCGCDRELVNGKRAFTCVHGPEFDGHLVDWRDAAARQRRYQDEGAPSF